MYDLNKDNQRATVKPANQMYIYIIILNNCTVGAYKVVSEITPDFHQVGLILKFLENSLNIFKSKVYPGLVGHLLNLPTTSLHHFKV